MPWVRAFSPSKDHSPGAVHPIEPQLFEREYKAMSDRVFSLMERHQQLDEALRAAQRQRAADPFEIVRLKKLKLVIKDRLARLLRQPEFAR
jgi:hypothetical protein